jgi:hypothetical protein
VPRTPSPENGLLTLGLGLFDRDDAERLLEAIRAQFRPELGRGLD